jgi:hypothetical protein
MNIIVFIIPRIYINVIAFKLLDANNIILMHIICEYMRKFSNLVFVEFEIKFEIVTVSILESMISLLILMFTSMTDDIPN